MDKLKQFLKKQGYKYDANSFIHYKVDIELINIPHCRINGKQPQMCIVESKVEEINYYTVSIYINNQTSLGWVKIGYFNLEPDILISKFKQYEAAVYEMWVSQFPTGQITIPHNLSANKLAEVYNVISDSDSTIVLPVEIIIPTDETDKIWEVKRNCL